MLKETLSMKPAIAEDNQSLWRSKWHKLVRSRERILRNESVPKALGLSDISWTHTTTLAPILRSSSRLPLYISTHLFYHAHCLY